MWSVGTNGKMKPIIECDIPDAYNMPRQKLPKVYIQNASIDVIRTKTILEKKSMTGDSIHGYIMDSFFDIDTYEQFEQSVKAIQSHNTKMTGKSFCFDIDGVIATLSPGNDYSKAKPIEDTIALVNYLYEQGSTIYLHTARGSLTGIDWRSVTEEQMRDWSVSYHKLVMGKPGADYYIDDRLISLSELKELTKGEI
jgi:CMP-N,N'-diacetyllegionaminic acid synthase